VKKKAPQADKKGGTLMSRLREQRMRSRVPGATTTLGASKRKPNVHHEDEDSSDEEAGKPSA